MTAQPVLELELLSEELVVARLEADAPSPAWADRAAPLTAIIRTAEELSIVVPRAVVPADVDAVGPWQALKVRGPLSFELTGILARLASVLAQARVAIFALSTYDTDYLLVRATATTTAVRVLRGAGYVVHAAEPGSPAHHTGWLRPPAAR